MVGEPSPKKSKRALLGELVWFSDGHGASWLLLTPVQKKFTLVCGFNEISVISPTSELPKIQPKSSKVMNETCQTEFGRSSCPQNPETLGQVRQDHMHPLPHKCNRSAMGCISLPRFSRRETVGANEMRQAVPGFPQNKGFPGLLPRTPVLSKKLIGAQC